MWEKGIKGGGEGVKGSARREFKKAGVGRRLEETPTEPRTGNIEDRTVIDEPRMTEPRMTEPRMTEPRMTEPRMTEPRMTEPRMTELKAEHQTTQH